MLKNKRGVVSLATFSFIVLILILVLVFSYYISDTYKTKSEVKIKSLELENSIYSFRYSLIELVRINNSNMTYVNNLDDLGMVFYLYNNTIFEKYDFNSGIINKSISSLGIKFCSNYSFSPRVKSKFNFNGSCISMN